MPQVAVKRDKRIKSRVAICAQCQHEFHAFPETWKRSVRKFCSHACYALFVKGKPSHNRKHFPGDRWQEKRGYWYVMLPDGSKRHEQVLIAEKVLRRALRRAEVVHHIDGDPGNNAHSNLLICTVAYHRWLHERMSHLYQQEKFGGRHAVRLD